MPISTATMAGMPVAMASSVPPAVKSPSPTASGHCTARSVGAKCRACRKNMARTDRPSSIQSHHECSTQKKGRRSSNISRSVPPPKALRPTTMHTPTGSSFLRAASIRPETANARIAAASMAIWAVGKVQALEIMLEVVCCRLWSRSTSSVARIAPGACSGHQNLLSATTAHPGSPGGKPH